MSKHIQNLRTLMAVCALFGSAAGTIEPAMVMMVQRQDCLIDLAERPGLLRSLSALLDQINFNESGPALKRLAELLYEDQLIVPAWLLRCASQELRAYALWKQNSRSLYRDIVVDGVTFTNADIIALAEALSAPSVPLNSINANALATATATETAIGAQFSNQNGGTQLVDIAVLQANSTQNSTVNIATAQMGATGESSVNIGSPTSTVNILGSTTIGSASVAEVLIVDDVNNTDLMQTISFNNVPVDGVSSKTIVQSKNSASATNASLPTTLVSSYGEDARGLTITTAAGMTRTVTGQTLMVGGVTGTFDVSATLLMSNDVINNTADIVTIAPFTPITNSATGKGTLHVEQAVSVGNFAPNIALLGGDSANIVQSTLNLGVSNVANAVPGTSTVGTITNIGTTLTTNGSSVVAIGSSNTGSTITINGAATFTGNAVLDNANNTNIAQTINFNNVPVNGTNSKAIIQAKNNASATNASLSTILTTSYGEDARSLTITAAAGMTRTVTGQTLTLGGVTGTFDVSAASLMSNDVINNTADIVTIAPFTPITNSATGKGTLDIEQTVSLGNFAPNIAQLGGDAANIVKSTLNLGVSNVVNAVPGTSTVKAVTNIGTTMSVNGISEVTIGSINTGSTTVVLGDVIASSINNTGVAQTINFNNVPANSTSAKTLIQAKNNASATNANVSATLNASYGVDARSLTLNAVSGLTRTISGQTLTIGGITGTFDVSDMTLMGTDVITNTANIVTIAPFTPVTNSTTGRGTLDIEQTVSLGNFAPNIALLGEDAANVIQSTLNLGASNVANAVPGTSTVKAITNIGTASTANGISEVTIGSANTGSMTTVLGNVLATTINNTDVAQTINYNNVPINGSNTKTVTQAKNNASATNANVSATLNASYGIDARSLTINTTTNMTRTVSGQTVTIGGITGTFDANNMTLTSNDIISNVGDVVSIAPFTPVTKSANGQGAVAVQQTVNVGFFAPDILLLGGNPTDVVQSTLNLGVLNVATTIPDMATVGTVTNIGTSMTSNGNSMVTIGSTNTGSILSLLSTAGGLSYKQGSAGNTLYPIGAATNIASSLTAPHALEICVANVLSTAATWNNAPGLSPIIGPSLSLLGSSSSTSLVLQVPNNYVIIGGILSGALAGGAVPLISTTTTTNDTIAFTTVALSAAIGATVILYVYRT